MHEQLTLTMGAFTTSDPCRCCLHPVYLARGTCLAGTSLVAEYVAQWSANPSGHTVSLAICLGNPEQATSVPIAVVIAWETAEQIRFRFADEAPYPSSHVSWLHLHLPREAAMSHPARPSFLRVCEEIVRHDTRVAEALARS